MFVNCIQINNNELSFKLAFQDENKTATATEAQPAADPDGAKGEGQVVDTIDKGKSKEEWVTLIFGEDGKEIPPQQEKSVYDLDPEEEDKHSESLISIRFLVTCPGKPTLRQTV